MNNRIVAKSVVFNNNGDILLLRRSGTDTRRPHQWDLPGGRVDKGESLFSASVREVREETGIEILADSASLVFSETAVIDQLNVVFLVFVSIASSNQVVLSSEHEESIWLPLKEAIVAIEYDRHQRALAHILDNGLLPKFTHLSPKA